MVGRKASIFARASLSHCGENQALVLGETDQQFGNLQALEQVDQVRFLVAGDIGPEDEDHDLDALGADLAADALLEVARHASGEVGDGVEQVVGDLIDRQVGVSGHAD